MLSRLAVCWCFLAATFLLPGCGSSEKDFEKEVVALEPEAAKVKGQQVPEELMVKASLLHERINTARQSKSIDATKAAQLQHRISELMVRAGRKDDKRGP